MKIRLTTPANIMAMATSSSSNSRCFVATAVYLVLSLAVLVADAQKTTVVILSVQPSSAPTIVVANTSTSSNNNATSSSSAGGNGTSPGARQIFIDLVNKLANNRTTTTASNATAASTSSGNATVVVATTAKPINATARVMGSGNATTAKPSAAAATTAKPAAGGVTTAKPNATGMTTAAAAMTTTVPVANTSWSISGPKVSVPMGNTSMITGPVVPTGVTMPSTAKPPSAAMTTAKATTAGAKATTAGAKATTAGAAETTKMPPHERQLAGTVDSDLVLNRVNATPLVFDCRRYQHDCNFIGGVCDMDTGKCSCGKGYAGYDCSIKTEWVRNATVCNNGDGCGDKAQSWCIQQDKASKPWCSCAYGLWGDKCADSPISLECGDDSMAIEVMPYPSFTAFEGLLFLVNTSADTMVESEACRFKQDDGYYKFESTYDNIVANCGGRADGDHTFSMKFIIQSDPHWLTPFDQVFNVKCISTLEQTYERSVIVSVSGSATARGLGAGLPVGVSNSLVNLPINQIVAEHKRMESFEMPRLVLSVSRVVVDSKWGNYSVAPITDALKIGDPVQITVANVNASFYTSLRTEDCLIKMDNSIEMKLITKSCPASKFAWSLLRWDRTVVTPSSISVWLILPANALAGQTRFVDIYCRVKVCTTDAKSDCEIRRDGCSNSSLPGSSPTMYPPSMQVANFGRRRRRDAVEADVEVDADGSDHEAAQASLVDDFFSSHPFVYTTVHSRFRLSYDDAQAAVSDAVSRSSASAPTCLSQLSSLLLMMVIVLTVVLF